MIVIDRKPIAAEEVLGEYPEGSLEREMLTRIASSEATFAYDSLRQLKFELQMRREIVRAANDLYRSGFSFEVFRDSYANTDFWVRMEDGGFALKKEAKASDAIRDIYTNGRLYGTECATAMVIIYYKALLEIFHDDAFNSIFTDIILMNWTRIDRELREIGYIQPAEVYLPGDRRYFANPDVNPLTPEWQGENVIDMGNELYYGHGIGLHKAEAFIMALNRNRREGSQKSAYLMDTVSVPNFHRLSELYDKISTIEPGAR